jgi:hypothetical protein
MDRLVHTGLGSSYLIAHWHVPHSPPPPTRTALCRYCSNTLGSRGAGGRRGSAPSTRATTPRQSLSYPCAGAVFRASSLGVVCTPPSWTGHGRKRPKMAGTLGSRVAGGRRGSAPSTRDTTPRQSLSYARAGAVFRASSLGVVCTPPSWTGHGRKRLKWLGRWDPGSQGAAGGLSRAPATPLLASPSHMRALTPCSGP